ncbi:hypothetical protein ACIP4Y_20815 [Streptomyces sp. NPDC088810]|uniref:hypothetical protein n=1 Tax=Streptomyces sp. NPDC088810 TaxID=3365904 RepID=UPI00382D94EF
MGALPGPAGLGVPARRIEAAFGRMLADSRGAAGGAPHGPEPVAVAHDSLARELALCALEEVVLRVAAASGFPSHFSRVFRARYGVPPGAYRAGERQ